MHQFVWLHDCVCSWMTWMKGEGEHSLYILSILCFLSIAEHYIEQGSEIDCSSNAPLLNMRTRLNREERFILHLAMERLFRAFDLREILQSSRFHPWAIQWYRPSIPIFLTAAGFSPPLLWIWVGSSSQSLPLPLSSLSAILISSNPCFSFSHG